MNDQAATGITPGPWGIEPSGILIGSSKTQTIRIVGPLRADGSTRGAQNIALVMTSLSAFVDGHDPVAEANAKIISEVPNLIARIEVLQAEVTRLRGLCVKSDGLFGLWRYRFKSTPMPDDLIGEIEEHIGNLRRASKGEI